MCVPSHLDAISRLAVARFASFSYDLFTLTLALFPIGEGTFEIVSQTAIAHIAVPAISGMVRLSSGGIPANSTKAAIAAPGHNAQWWATAPVATSKAAIAAPVAAKARVPPGGLATQPGPRETTAHYGGHRVAQGQEEHDGYAHLPAEQPEYQRRSYEHVSRAGNSGFLLALEQRGHPPHVEPVERANPKAGQFQPDRAHRQHGEGDQEFTLRGEYSGGGYA